MAARAPLAPLLLVPVLAAAPLFAGCGGDRAEPAAAAEGRTLTVTGTGRYAANPNLAAVDLVVQVEADTAAESVETAQARLADLKDALARAGVDRADMQSMDDALAEATAAGARVFRAKHVLRVTVRNLLRLPAVLDAARGAGVERLGSVHYGLGDPGLLAERARVAAHADALARAQVLAEEAGLAVGEVLSIEEAAAPPWPHAPLPEPSPYELSVTVTVTYALAPR